MGAGSGSLSLVACEKELTENTDIRSREAVRVVERVFPQRGMKQLRTRRSEILAKSRFVGCFHPTRSSLLHLHSSRQLYRNRRQRSKEGNSISDPW